MPIIPENGSGYTLLNPEKPWPRSQKRQNNSEFEIDQATRQAAIDNMEEVMGLKPCPPEVRNRTI